MEPRWLDESELVTWTQLVALVELLPGALDAQLRRDAHLTHFEYLVLAMLSEAEGRTLRMTALARRTNATLPRLSHVVKRLEQRGVVERATGTDDRRATDVRLTDAGWQTLVAAAPGHVEHVRSTVLDPLRPEQVDQLRAITSAVLGRLDPEGAMTYRPSADQGRRPA